MPSKANIKIRREYLRKRSNLLILHNEQRCNKSIKFMHYSDPSASTIRVGIDVLLHLTIGDEDANQSGAFVPNSLDTSSSMRQLQ
jgi:hypothetical protein